MRVQLGRWVRKGLTTIAAGILASAMLAGSLLGSGTTAQAAGQTGSLTITPTGIEGAYTGTFKAYRVGSAGGEQHYTRADAFKDYDGTWLDGIDPDDNARARQIAQSLAQYVRDNEIAADVSGIAINTKVSLAYGVYLIMQDASDAVYLDTEPFLVQIPQYTKNDDGTMTTSKDVVVSPKCEKPGKPDEPHHPHDEETHESTKYGRVSFGKSDAVTALPLAGVEFALCKGDGTVIGTYTTDENGIIYVDHLPYGQYYWVEIKALDGYVLDETPQGFQIAAEDTVLVTMTNMPVTEVPEETPEEGPHGFTGDSSNMVLYGVIVVVAAAALVGWIVWRRRSEREAE